MEHWITRLFLSVAIIVSLVPHEWMHTNDLVFMLLFGPEFVVRVLLACRSEVADEGADEGEEPRLPGWRMPKPSTIALLAVDLVALVSFLPLGSGGEATRWLRVFRLSRTLLLLRYWGPLVRDLGSVLTRRERARQIVLLGVAAAVISFAGAVALDHMSESVGDDFDGDGDWGDEHDHLLAVRWWWAFRQVQDPGNLLHSPHETGTLVISVALTVFGLFLVSFLIGVGTDVVQEVMEVGRIRPVGLSNHTVVVNVTPSTRQLLFELIRETQKRRVHRKWSLRALRSRFKAGFVVVGQDEDEPDFLRDKNFQGVTYRADADDDDDAFLMRADVKYAERVVLLADGDRRDPDDHTIRTMLTLVEHVREQGDNELPVHLYAEILDENNVAAAQRAISRAQGRVHAQIVPTERLLGFFMACVGRRSGVASLLLDMLDSAGHELYTHDYGAPDPSSAQVYVPGAAKVHLPAGPRQAMTTLYQQGTADIPERRVLPVGVLIASPDPEDGTRHVRISVNPESDELVDDERVEGFVAIGYSDRAIREFSARFADGSWVERPVAPASGSILPEFTWAGSTPLERILVCGWRSGTVNLVEALMTADRGADVLILVANDSERAKVFDDFDAYSALVRDGILFDRVGLFEEDAVHDCLRYRTVGGEAGTGRVMVEVGDWTSSRQLMRLPREFGNVAGADLVMFISEDDHEADARTATALMKLENVRDLHARNTGERKRQRVVAEIFGTDLARRLWNRYESIGEEDIRVFSIQELRALFMFQSVAVDYFEKVYAELMAPWGQSFSRLLKVGDAVGTCTFIDLARHLQRHDQLLVGVELVDGQGRRTMQVGGAEAESDVIDLGRLHSVWVVQDEAAAAAAAREGRVLRP